MSALTRSLCLPETSQPFRSGVSPWRFVLVFLLAGLAHTFCRLVFYRALCSCSLVVLFSPLLLATYARASHLYPSSLQVTPIVNSRCVEPARAHHPRAEPSRDQLPFETLPLGAVNAMPPPALEAHLTVAYNALTEALAPVRQTGQTLLYLQSLAPIPRVANLLINSTFLVLLLR